MFVIYDGPSRLNGKPIIAVMTFGSINPKTGDMAQTWILDKNTPPHKAIQTGADESVCGDCALRGTPLGTINKGRRCYVTMHMAPRAVHQAYHNGSYREPEPTELNAWLQTYSTRLGSYGEPAALPRRIINGITKRARGWTSYTHQWRRFKGLIMNSMASVESLKDARAAWAKGWRTFRILQPGEKLTRNEILCPASKEAGQLTTCEDCRLCQGLSSGTWKSIGIYDHGPQRKRS